MVEVFSSQLIGLVVGKDGEPSNYPRTNETKEHDASYYAYGVTSIM